MSVYRKAVQGVLRKGTKPRSELLRELCPRMMSAKKLQSTLNEIEDEKQVICVPRREEGSRKWAS